MEPSISRSAGSKDWGCSDRTQPGRDSNQRPVSTAAETLSNDPISDDTVGHLATRPPIVAGPATAQNLCPSLGVKEMR